VQTLCAAAGTRLGEVVPLGKRAESQEWCIGAMGELNLSELNLSELNLSELNPSELYPGESNLKACGEDDIVR
jgi:hypothetical protein